jgi:hypothetical protein
LAESVVLADECFLLTRDGSSRRGRIKPMLQYCPRCLQTDARPYFRRAWRFAHIAVCLEHGCQLHDRCWHCDSPVAPLTQRGIDPIPRCSSCEAVLAEATASPSLARPRQAALQALLEYLALHIPPHQRAPHLDALARRFGSAMRGRVALRGTAVAGLFPASMALWFGRPVDARHAQALQALAEGVNPASAAAAARQKALRERRAAKTKRAIRDSDLAQDSRHKSLLDYSATAQTSIWKLIEGHLNRMEASADHGAQSADQNR